MWEWTLVINNNWVDSTRFAQCPHVTRYQSLLPERKYFWLLKEEKISLLVSETMIQNTSICDSTNLLHIFNPVLISAFLFCRTYHVFISIRLDKIALFHIYRKTDDPKDQVLITEWGRLDVKGFTVPIYTHTHFCQHKVVWDDFPFSEKRNEHLQIHWLQLQNNYTVYIPTLNYHRIICMYSWTSG